MHALLLVLVATWLTFGGDAQPEIRGDSSPAFVVIVDPQNPIDSVDRKFLADAFLKKATRWGHGARIRPVDLSSGSPIRRTFSQTIIGRSVAAVRSFWQQQVFSGRDVPPTQRSSDADVVAFVRANANAIGYVSRDTALGAGVRAVAVRS